MVGDFWILQPTLHKADVRVWVPSGISGNKPSSARDFHGSMADGEIQCG